MRASRVRRGAVPLATPATYFWFYKQVRNKGPWDYKQKGRQYEGFGNFHYGAVGRAAGIPEHILLRAAGCAQTLAGTSQLDWRGCRTVQPYGDDPRDQRWIRSGYEYAKTRGY
ncbi:polymorphic toxin type 44 domain-containing protein [Burkholderia latens]|nr:polymorphic toxin type 44 domain-containing protein [Burkholderia latens]